MRLLHCINSPHIGGIERLVIELAIEQQRQGVAVSIMLDTRNGQYYDYLKLQKIPLLDSSIKGGFDIKPKTYKRLKQIFNTFDVIHLHSFSPIRSMAANASRSKVVYTIHGLSKGVRQENFLKYQIRERLKHFFLNRVDVLVANSNYTLSLAKQHYGLRNTKGITILNGIKLGERRLKSNTSPNDIFTIGLITRFTARKRIDRLLRSFKVFLDNDHIGKLILVGDGGYFNNVIHLIKDLNLDQNVELTGYKNNVQDYYKKFDVFVHPSDNEGFGLAAVEAYLEGLPVIAFNDSGGLKEVVSQLEPQNIVLSEAELAERLKFYYENRKEILENAEERIAYARKNYSIDRMERDYHLIYKSLTVL